MDEYNPDQPEAVVPPEVVVDDPKKPWKAYVPTAMSAVSLFVMAWVADEDPFTAKEIAAAVVAALTTSGVIGAMTYLTPNPKKVART
jgi:predicted lysophospholipase L1 biosynthesis ABC-type transport system permease subunit